MKVFRSPFLLSALAMLGLASASCASTAHRGLTFSTWGSIDEIGTLKPLLAEFRAANPDVPVELIHIPDEYPHKVRLMAAARRMPDVLFMENQTLPGFAKQGVLRDLGPMLAKDRTLARADFFKPCLDALTWHDTLYAIPRDLSNLVIFYNRDLLRRAGLADPPADWTYERMVEMAGALTVRAAPGKPADQWGIGFAPFPIYWLPYLWSDGADVLDPGLTRCTLLDPPALAALHRYADLRARYHVAPTEAEVGNARMSQLFAQGKLAMMVGGRWVVPGFREKLTFDWDVAAFPRGRAGSIVDADASGWAISAACREPEAAWRLIRFLASKPAITAFTKSGLIVPSRRDVAGSPVFLAGKPAHGRVFLDAIATARPTLTPPSYDEMLYELIDGLPPAWNGDEPLETTLRPIVKRIDALLEEDRR